MAELTALDGASFDMSIASDDQPILVDFWAPWCGSCRLLTPTVSLLADELSADLRFAKVDVDEESALAERLEVMSLPTLVMYRSGKEVVRINGVKNKAALLEIINKHL